ncbi:MAG: hypothetical protein AAGI01_14045 [Myxococcota bacterium]
MMNTTKQHTDLVVKLAIAPILALALGCNVVSLAQEGDSGVRRQTYDGDPCLSEACRFEVSLRFIPPGTSEYLPQWVDSVEIEYRTGRTKEFVLEPSVPITGRLSLPQSATNLVTGAVLDFEATNAPGNVFRRQVEVDQRGEFTLDVVPGTYEITATFAASGGDVELPSRKFPARTYAAATREELTLPSERLTLKGTLSFIDEGNPQRLIQLAGSRVVARSRRDGSLSNAVRTDESTGFFDGLQVWSRTGSYDLLISPPVPNSPMPSIVVEEQADSGELADDVSTLTVAKLPAPEDTLTVEFDTSGLPADLAGHEVRVALSAQDTFELADGRMTRLQYDRRATVGYPGAAALEVHPRSYTLEVLPGPEAPYGRIEVELDLSDGADGGTVALPERRCAAGSADGSMTHSGTPWRERRWRSRRARGGARARALENPPRPSPPRRTHPGCGPCSWRRTRCTTWWWTCRSR